MGECDVKGVGYDTLCSCADVRQGTNDATRVQRSTGQDGWTEEEQWA